MDILVWLLIFLHHQPLILSQRQILDSSKLKGFADNNLKFDENVTHFSKQLENTVGKGKIASYDQFLLFPQCFKKTHKNFKTRACLGYS